MSTVNNHNDFAESVTRSTRESTVASALSLDLAIRASPAPSPRPFSGNYPSFRSHRASDSHFLSRDEGFVDQREQRRGQPPITTRSSLNYFPEDQYPDYDEDYVPPHQHGLGLTEEKERAIAELREAKTKLEALKERVKLAEKKVEIIDSLPDTLARSIACASRGNHGASRGGHHGSPNRGYYYGSANQGQYQDSVNRSDHQGPADRGDYNPNNLRDPHEHRGNRRGNNRGDHSSRGGRGGNRRGGFHQGHGRQQGPHQGTQPDEPASFAGPAVPAFRNSDQRINFKDPRSLNAQVPALASSSTSITEPGSLNARVPAFDRTSSLPSGTFVRPARPDDSRNINRSRCNSPLPPARSNPSVAEPRPPRPEFTTNRSFGHNAEMSVSDRLARESRSTKHQNFQTEFESQDEYVNRLCKSAIGFGGTMDSSPAAMAARADRFGPEALTWANGDAERARLPGCDDLSRDYQEMQFESSHVLRSDDQEAQQQDVQAQSETQQQEQTQQAHPPSVLNVAAPEFHPRELHYHGSAAQPQVGDVSQDEIKLEDGEVDESSTWLFTIGRRDGVGKRVATGPKGRDDGKFFFSSCLFRT